MKIKEKLNQVRMFERQIRSLKCRIENYNQHKNLLEVSLDFCSGIDYCITNTTDIINNIFIKRGDAEILISKIIDADVKFVLEKYFLHDCETKEIAIEMGYCSRHIDRLLENGLLELEKIISLEENDIF